MREVQTPGIRLQLRDQIGLYAQFGWRFKPPFGAVHLVYNGDDRLYATERRRFRSDVFFLKMTYPIGR